jgi:hypothetical protein
MGDEVESEAEWFQAALSKVLHSTAKKIMFCTHSKRWWNGEIQEKSCQLGRETRNRRRSSATAQAMAELQKSVRRAKDKMWNGYLKNLRGAEVWRAAKFASRRARMIVEALLNREGKQENTITETEEMLGQQCFPPNEYNPYFGLPPAGQVHLSGTVPEVERALFSLSVPKSPVPRKLSL